MEQSMMSLKTRVSRIYSDHPNQVQVFATEGLDEVGRFAMALMLESLDAMPVAKAFNTAELFFKEARERGHVIKIPDLNEVNTEFDAKSNRP
jgi:hypothetical protein